MRASAASFLFLSREERRSFIRLVCKAASLILVFIHCSLSGSPFPLLLNFIDMLKIGKNKPWPEALKKLIGSEVDGGAARRARSDTPLLDGTRTTLLQIESLHSFQSC